MTWSTPVCVEIYENRYVGFENLGLELTVVKVDYFAVCLLFAHHAEKVGEQDINILMNIYIIDRNTPGLRGQRTTDRCISKC